jgi:CDP-diacylglycerol--glycerol-3-phosphate 3-phosphatidyltransferase
VSGQPDIDPVVPRARVANIANVLTGVRLVLVPVFLAMLFVGDGHETFWRIAAFVVFAVAVITDRFDGALARSYGMVTEFGKLADPIADKALIGAALIGLSMIGDLPWWVTVVIMVREVGITALRFAVLRRGVIPASRGGKLKTLVPGRRDRPVRAAALGALADRRMGGDVGRRGADGAHRRRLCRLCGQGFAWTTRWSLRTPAHSSPT